MNADPADAAGSRRSRLLGVKLRALVAEHLAAEVPEPVIFAPGAAVLVDGTAWVLLDDQPGSRLGAALVWAFRAGAGRLAVVADSATGVLARRAERFALPIEVWHAEGRTLLPAVPEPLPVPIPAPAHHEELRALIEQGGATPVVEHGILAGEVAGLEVCRVVDDPHLGVTRLEVGVGAHDREAFQMLHGDRPTAESLARIVDVVATHRRPGAPPHPLNQLAAERLLRWRLEQVPGLIGATSVRPVPPPVPRPNLKDRVPCVAIADADGDRPFVVVCSSGVDLDLVPFAADARPAAAAAGTGVGDGDRLVVVTPTRDRLRVTEQLAALLVPPAELASLD